MGGSSPCSTAGLLLGPQLISSPLSSSSLFSLLLFACEDTLTPQGQVNKRPCCKQPQRRNKTNNNLNIPHSEHLVFSFCLFTTFHSLCFPQPQKPSFSLPPLHFLASFTTSTHDAATKVQGLTDESIRNTRSFKEKRRVSSSWFLRKGCLRIFFLFLFSPFTKTK